MLPVAQCAAKSLETLSVLPVRFGSGTVTTRPEDKYTLSNLRTCDDGWVLCFNKLYHPVAIHVTPNDSEDDAISVVEANLLLGIKATCLYTCLCPASGRMMFVTEDHDVYVVDYLHGP